MIYEKYQNRFKICALCSNRILSGHVVCEDHLPEMELYKNELWFQELCRMQERQYQIDTEEFRFINGMNYVPLQKQIRTRGKQLPNNIRKEIISLYKKGLGARKISKLLKFPFSSVNTVIWRYKKYNTK